MKLNGKPIDILRVVDLKEELAKRDLPKHGKKQDLVQRLTTYLEQNPHECDAEGSDDAGGGGGAAVQQGQVVSEQLAQNDAVAEYLRMRESALENAQNIQHEQEPAVPQVEEPQAAVETPQQQVPEPVSPQVPQVPVEKASEALPEPAPSQPEADAAVAQVASPSPQEDAAAAKQEMEVDPTPEREPTPPPPQPKSQPEAKVQPEQAQTSPPEEEVISKPPVQEKEAEETPAQETEKEEPSSAQKEEKSESVKDSPADENVAEPPPKLPEVEEEREKADDSVVVTVDATDLEFGDESLNTSTRSTTKEQQAKRPQEEKEDDDPHNFRTLKDLEPESSQLVSLRKIQRSKSTNSSNGEDVAAGKKRTWGSSKYSKETSRMKDVSSKSLKDLVPDIQPLLDEEKEVDLEPKNDQDEDEGRRRSSSRQASTEEKKVPKPKITATSSVIRIDNLVRPFTVNQIKELLARTGTLVEDSFWINKVKSTCLVAYSTKEEAEETIAALDGVKWPSSNPKQISVKPSTEEELNAFLSGAADARQNGSAPRSNNREDNSRPKETSESKKRPIADEDEEAKSRKKRRREEESSGGGSGKTLEELFRKTKTQPSIYWLPNDGKP